MNEERVHHETYKCFWDNLPTNFSKSFFFQNRKFSSPFLLYAVYNFTPACTINSLRHCDPLNQYYLSTPKYFPDRPLIIPQECHVSTDSAQIDPDSIPIAVALPYLHLSKVFDHKPNDKALKIYITLASQQHAFSEQFFVTAQSAAFISEKRYQHKTNTNSKSASYAQVTSSAKVY